MNKHLTGVMVAVFAAAMLFPSPTFADHRPGNVVVMGGTLALTGGPHAPAAKRTYNSFILYVDELNARGGLLGHVVELKIYDDKQDKRRAVELYEKLITEDKVDLVVGPYPGKLNDTVANVMERYRRPFVGVAPRRSFRRGRKYIFSTPKTTGSGADRLKGPLHIAKRIGIERIAIISGATSGKLRRFVATNAWAKKLGLKIVLSERYPPKQRDFRDLLRKIEASGAEAIFSHSNYRESGAQLRQLRELNINVKMFASTIGPSSPKFIKELGALAEYVIGRASWLPKPALGHPGIAEFTKNYVRRFGEEPNYQSANGYTKMQITEAAVKKAGSFDPEKVREALATMAVYTIKGPYKADTQGLSVSANVTGHLNYQIQNGKRVLLWPEDKAEGKFLPMPKWEDRAKK